MSMKTITKILIDRFASGSVYPIITAHSGCEGTPDNSLEHVRCAIASGADAFEIDIHMGENGVLILTHDAPNGSETIPTLAEAFELTAAHPSVCVNCDVKEEFLKAPVIALAKEYGLESRIVFTGSYHMDELSDLDKSDADWWINIWNGTPEQIDLAYENYAKLGEKYRILNHHYSLVNDEFAQRAEKAGYYLSAWTVNDEENLRRMMACPRIINITTRIPKKALEIRKEIFGI